MKLYTDYTGKYQMYIPIEWEYKNPSFYENTTEGFPQSFGLYDGAVGTFQISCEPINTHITELIEKRHELIQSSDAKKLSFSEIKTTGKDMEIFIFSCPVDDHYFLATYIIPAKDKHNEKIKSELAAVRKTLSSVKFIKPEYRNRVIGLRRFDMFMSSIATTIDLMNKASENSSFIEYVALSANKIDALLRLSLILTNQINSKINEIDTTLLFQSEEDKPTYERSIYKSALDNYIIKQDLYDELEELYKQRNKVVHRYIITDIRTIDVKDIAIRYTTVDERISVIVSDLEKKQFELGIGIYGNNQKLENGFDDIEMKILMTKIRDKHGKVN